MQFPSAHQRAAAGAHTPVSQKTHSVQWQDQGDRSARYRIDQQRRHPDIRRSRPMIDPHDEQSTLVQDRRKKQQHRRIEQLAAENRRMSRMRRDSKILERNMVHMLVTGGKSDTTGIADKLDGMKLQNPRARTPKSTGGASSDTAPTRKGGVEGQEHVHDYHQRVPAAAPSPTISYSSTTPRRKSNTKRESMQDSRVLAGSGHSRSSGVIVTRCPVEHNVRTPSPIDDNGVLLSPLSRECGSSDEDVAQRRSRSPARFVRLSRAPTKRRGGSSSSRLILYHVEEEDHS